MAALKWIAEQARRLCDLLVWIGSAAVVVVLLAWVAGCVRGLLSPER